MGEILGIGCPHGPHLRFTDETMANNYFRHNLRSDKTPAHWKDPKNWPERMREEWGHDEGVSAARRHREEALKGYRAARAAIDAFNPDFILIFGDDQYENFKVDVLPPFCIYAHEEFEMGGGKGSGRSQGLNVGTLLARPPMQSRVKGSKKFGTLLATELIQRGFDVACSWEMHHLTGLGHAFVYTLDYLDWDRKGFPYSVIPFHVNCYGDDIRLPPPPGTEPVVGRLPETKPEVAPPASPPPWRCYDLGKTVARIIEASPYRVVMVGSSSWSHASLTNLHGFLWGDVDADRQRLGELKAGEHYRWRELDAKRLRASGQHEMLNWICLAGAMEGRRAEILAYAETYIFNSCKCVALFSLPRQESEPARKAAAPGDVG